MSCHHLKGNQAQLFEQMGHTGTVRRKERQLEQDVKRADSCIWATNTRNRASAALGVRPGQRAGMKRRGGKETVAGRHDAHSTLS
jgi:hypothetical protein